MSQFIYDDAKCYYAECRSDECRGAQIIDLTKKRFAMTLAYLFFASSWRKKIVKIVAPVDSVRKHYFFLLTKKQNKLDCLFVTIYPSIV